MFQPDYYEPTNLIKLSFTPAGLASCQQFITQHNGPLYNTEQLEATAAASLLNLFELFDDEKWVLGSDTQRFGALSTNYGHDYHVHYMHATRQADDSWLVGTPEEFPVSEEYLKRRQESEAAIIKSLTA